MESFNKIVDAIVTRIQKTFEDPINIVTSIKNKKKTIYIEAVVNKAATEGTDAERVRRDRLSEKKWEIMFNRYQDKVENFDSL